MFYSNESFYQSLSHILRHFAHIVPMCTVWNADGQFCSLHTSIFFATFCHKALELLIIYIANALEEQQREDVFLPGDAGGGGL